MSLARTQVLQQILTQCTPAHAAWINIQGNNNTIIIGEDLLYPSSKSGDEDDMGMVLDWGRGKRVDKYTRRSVGLLEEFYKKLADSPQVSSSVVERKGLSFPVPDSLLTPLPPNT